MLAVDVVALVPGEEAVAGQQGLRPQATHAVLAAGEQHVTHRPPGGSRGGSLVTLALQVRTSVQRSAQQSLPQEELFLKAQYHVSLSPGGHTPGAL